MKKKVTIIIVSIIVLISVSTLSYVGITRSRVNSQIEELERVKKHQLDSLDRVARLEEAKGN